MNLKFTIIAIFILLIIFISNHYIEFYKKKDEEKYKDTIKHLTTFKKFLTFLVILIIIIGFCIYYSEKRIEYQKNWSNYKFIFGVNQCKSLK